MLTNLVHVVFLIAFNPTDPVDTVGILYEYEGESALLECQIVAGELNRGEIGTDSVLPEMLGGDIAYACESGWASAVVEYDQ